MAFRKLYLKTRLFLYSQRKISNKVIVILMVATLLYLFFNFFVCEKFIVGEANYFQINHRCKAALMLYDAVYPYYSFNHFSEKNKEIYFEIPYRMSLCYLEENDKENSVKSMLNGITAIQKQYGMFSPETAYFIRKYLIQYLFTINSVNLAQKEFNFLLKIYQKIGYDNNVYSDLLCLSGDLYYQQQNYAEAIIYYEQAYNKIISQENIDYKVFTKIVGRIGDYYIQNKDPNKTISLYKNSINILKNAGSKYADLTANMFIKLRDLYSQNDQMTKEAISCYEQASSIIKQLPKTNNLRQNFQKHLTTLKNLYNKDNQFHKADEMDVQLARERRFSFLP